jgi:hypothetical protein
MSNHTLILERRSQQDETPTLGDATVSISITPLINEDYWAYRVRLGERQAIVGFPKFFTVGIGFALEEDWNTNLPYTCDTQEIFEHIRDNKGDDSITNDDVRTAIAMVQDAIREDLAAVKS